jgi:hypothetical protein
LWANVLWTLLCFLVATVIVGIDDGEGAGLLAIVILAIWFFVEIVASPLVVFSLFAVLGWAKPQGASSFTKREEGGDGCLSLAVAAMNLGILALFLIAVGVYFVAS